jgi:acetyl-CoA acetyltransferase
MRSLETAPGRVAAVAGVGFTPFSRDSGRSVLALATEAVAGAVADAGLRLDEVDGMNSFMVSDDSVPCVAVSSALGLGQLRTVLDVQLGGQAPCHLVWQAAQSVARGDAEVVVVYRALNGRSGARVGSMQFAGMGGQYRYPIGYGAYLMYVGMWAQRFLYETGQGPEDLGAVAVSQRRYAQDNERAARRQPLELAAYLAEPYVVEPYRRSDCTSWLRDELFGRAGVAQGDVDVAEIYDCFTSTVLMGLEGLGLCGRGESGEFVRSGACALDGRLPTNTGGGLLAEGYLHGMNTVAEAVLQVQGRGGIRQAPRHEVAVVTSGALMDGSAMILTADR